MVIISRPWDTPQGIVTTHVLLPLGITLDLVSAGESSHRVRQKTRHGPLTRYVKLRVAPGMPGTFSPPLRVSDPGMHHGTCVTHVPWCIPGLLTSGFLWSRWRGKRSRHSRRMRNPQFYVSDKRPIQRTTAPSADQHQRIQKLSKHCHIIVICSMI